MKNVSVSFDSSTDEELLAYYAEGDPRAAKLLVERLAPAVLRLASNLLPDKADAEEITQETFLRLWKIAPDWQRGRAKVSTWLWRVAANLCADWLRKKRPASLQEIDDPADGRPMNEARLMDLDRANVLKGELMKLPVRQRTAIALRHLECASNPEIAAAMSISVEAVESLLSRGMKTLRRNLIGRKAELGWEQ
ncbi:MAG: sigma-70 family RNA polymerase sigma factor [Albidovulum sp.]|nr:sigma-70 family RNA polymerase sigma factor [Albidovulum sp.]MDE0306592.1 sigma-70 family RNA polymerase sigma factor [Albidovulum sp.]MDE0530524.1 sigma-70 family RNA polymerase sigma factor [Albidovulum sp.]